ncbi:MAG: Cysteine desulfurase [Syntrophus sp. PtaB.Bin001]|nr:MAG: Cysteine desulfurase [Syntrophus sp. PtaB.Bin001]
MRGKHGKAAIFKAMDNLLKMRIRHMARINQAVLTEEHFPVLEFVYEYYRKHGVGPLYRNIQKHTGAGREDLDRLFPHGIDSVYVWLGIPVQSMERGCKPSANVPVVNRRDVYLDYNATTPVRKEVLQSLKAFHEKRFSFGNPGSSTRLGKEAYDLIWSARRQIAACLNVKPENIIFTGSGSEANNLAVKGIAFQHLNKKAHIVGTAIEHSSVLNALHYLRKIGIDVSFLDVDSDGRVSPDDVRKALRNETVLVSVMAANNEIGTINPLTEIGAVCRAAGVPFMVDAVQAFGKMELKPKELGISLLSLSGHKIYAPKGIGALFVDEDISLIPLVHGGEQEFGLRAGTENVGGIVALGKASRLAHAEMEKENARLLKLRTYFLEMLQRDVPDCIVNGSLEHRLPNTLSVGFPGVDSGSLLLSLNEIGVYVSSGSACSAGSSDISHVIQAIGVDTSRYGVLRFSFGLETTKEDIDYLFKYLPAILRSCETMSNIDRGQSSG